MTLHHRTLNGSTMIKLVMTMMMSVGLLPTQVVLVAAQTHPDNSGVFAAENVHAFALHQIELFVTDCEAWADTFAWNQSAKFCDGYVKECIFDYEGAVASCRRDTQGGSKVFHHENRTIMPRWFVDHNHSVGLPIPMWNEIAIKGRDTLCQILEQDFGFGRFTPICYDFVQVNRYVENPAKTPFGLDTIHWDGMYTIGLGTCPGYPPVQCEESTTATDLGETEDLSSDNSDSSGVCDSPSVAWHVVVVWTAWMVVEWLVNAY